MNLVNTRFGYLIGLLPLLLIALIFLPQFDGLYGQDSFAYYHFSIDDLLPNLNKITHWPAFFWPPGYPITVALASFITGQTPLSGQLVSLLSALLIPVLTALLAREVWRDEGWGVPLVAALLVGGMGQLWQSSLVVMSDTLSLAFGLAGMWLVARYGHNPTASRLLLATSALSFACLSRWAYPLVAIPCTAFTLLTMRSLPRAKFVRHFLLAAVTVILILFPVWFSILQQRIHAPSGAFAYIGDFQAYGWHPRNAFSRVHVTTDGILRYALPNGIYYASAPAHPLYFTPLLALFGLPGLWLAWRNRSRSILLLIIAWIAIVVLFHAGAPHQNFRFTLVYLPPTAILVAAGIVFVGRKIPHTYRWLFCLYLLLGYSWMLLSGYTNLQEFVTRFSRLRDVATWVDTALPENSRLLSFDITATVSHYSDLDVFELFYLSEADVAAFSAESFPLYLLIDLNKVETQWVGKAPSDNYRWLRDNPGLREIGQQQGYTLFEVAQ